MDAASQNAAQASSSPRYFRIPDYRNPPGVRLAVNVCVAYDVMIKRRMGNEPAQELTQGEFGGRVGVWRLLQLFKQHGVGATFYTPGRVCELYPDSLRQVAAQGHELAAMPWEKRIPPEPELEREHLRLTTEALTRIAGKRPVGFSGIHSLALLQNAGYQYRSSLVENAYDVPYYVGDLAGNHLLNLPTHFVLDDAMYGHFGWMGSVPGGQHLTDPQQVYEIWLAALRAFYQHGGYVKLLVHPFVSGRAGRIAMLDRLLTEIKRLPGVGFPTCSQLTAHCLEHFPLSAVE